MRRILIDASTVNINLHGGGAHCVKAYIEALTQLYPNRVDILHPKEACIRDARYQTIDVPSRSLWQRIGGFFLGQFHRGASFLLQYIKERPDTYELVFLNGGLYAGGIIDQLRRQNIKVVVLHHNYEPEYRLSTPSVITLGGVTTALVKYWEKKSYTQADINLFLTEHDRQTFFSHYGQHPHSYTSGIFETSNAIPTIRKDHKKQSAIISCSLGTFQNQKPLLDFIARYWPIFHKNIPDWQLVLAGRNPTEAIQKAVTSFMNITICANPMDMNEPVAQSSMYICPMYDGGGIKLRIMDGLRLGLPVLTHERAARGYETFSQEPFFLTYNDEASFEQQLGKLYHYICSQQFAPEEVQQKYFHSFSLEAGTNRLKHILFNE